MSSERQETVRASEAADSPKSAFLRWLGRLVRLVLMVGALAAGAGAAFYWVAHRPQARRMPPPVEARLVEVRPVRREARGVTVRTMGTVVPARSIELASEVGGRIVEVSADFVPGGRFQAGEQILQIDRRDFELTVAQRNSDLLKAQSSLNLEMGQQSVAQREYELLGEEVQEEDRELLLRKPQLESARAAVSAAQAALDRAELDLERTTVKAPFNATVRARHVDLGSQINRGTPLASLAGTDEYWVEASVPLDELRWIDIPGYNADQGSSARVYHTSAWGEDVFRTGRVRGLLTALEPQGRMARLLIAVRDPLDLGSASHDPRPLILDSYVRAAVEGRELPGVVEVPRTALRDEDRVWVMGRDGLLDIREVELAWTGDGKVYVSEGLSDGDLLVTSDLAAPVEGMALRTAADSARKATTAAGGRQGDAER